ncbi:probable 2-oxoglutarate-dependent dioxygenase At5g05600 [Tripterygium wilfordii]|uniref:probable 2-oxoglutarate-dependent dioxygenase At5g05600 n=1 Tax=Tripterygium wilfordii TaxID=458696 RepID=UPI0018F7ECAA|nr:probable 2-oxoglutarate-dependent dioxygenase At5g05600 [Tripterygium wilfordii]
MGDVDPAFIQDPEFRPKLEFINEAEGIPVINLSDDSKQIVLEIGEASKNWGFFQVINHGVPLELRQRIEKVSKEFFHQPLEEKRKVKRNDSSPVGYHESEHTKNVRDWKEIFDFFVDDQTLVPASSEPDDQEVITLINQWPESPPGFREVCKEYAREVEELGHKVMELICLSLGLPADRCRGYFTDQTSVFRLNYFPPCPVPHLALGVGPHKDASVFTVLTPDDSVGGLEVKRKSDGEWVRVQPIPEAFIINLGDIFQVWSNDAYESVMHRVVVNSVKERVSMPFFFFPSHYVLVKPLDELVNELNPAKYKGHNWGKFFASRNLSNYKKLPKENLLIHHYKVSE